MAARLRPAALCMPRFREIDAHTSAYTFDVFSENNETRHGERKLGGNFVNRIKPKERAVREAAHATMTDNGSLGRAEDGDKTCEENLSFKCTRNFLYECNLCVCLCVRFFLPLFSEEPLCISV